jgi:hypothetical protein
MSELVIERISHAMAKRKAAGESEAELVAYAKKNGIWMIVKTFDEVIRESFVSGKISV